MQVDWTPLRRELARHRANGMALRFWWRDDDRYETNCGAGST